MREIDWIKDAVAACVANEILEQERQDRFDQLARQYQAFLPESKEQINQMIKSQFQAKDGIYLYSFFLKYMKGYQEFAESVIDLAIKEEWDAYTGSMLELQTRKYWEEFCPLYPKLRAFHKKNVDKFDQELQIDVPYIELNKRNKNRIVIVTEQILHTLHAPTALVMNFAYSLKKMGYEILIFICPSDAVVPQDLWYQPINLNSLPRFRDMPFQLVYRNETFEGYQINMLQSVCKEYHMMLRLIHAWNPCFVFNLGAGNPVMDLTAKFTTLVVFEMSTNCPVSEGNIFIRPGKSEDNLEKMYAQTIGDSQKQFFTTEKYPLWVDGGQGKFKRSDLGLPEGRFLTAIVGNRLDVDISERFQSLMDVMLGKLPNMDFVIIGKAEKLKERFADKVYAHRIYFLGFQKELMEVY